MLVKQLPEPVLAVFRQGRTAEFTTLNKSGAPVTWPTLPFFDEAADRFIVTTSIAFPDKVYNVRRTPRVALHYSDPTGSGLAAPPIVLVQGDAVAPDELIFRDGVSTAAAVTETSKLLAYCGSTGATRP